MARLIGGIGIYLSVLLLLMYASAAHAVAPVTGLPETVPEHCAAKRADTAVFDLASLEPKPCEALAGHAGDGFEPALQPEAGAERNAALEKARRHLRGPALSYHAGNRGPVIELGMFGGTVRPRQRLAHLALDWDF